MIKFLAPFLMLLLILLLSSPIQAGVEDNFRKTEKLPIPGSYLSAKSAVIGSEGDQDSCGPKEHSFFVFKGDTDDINRMNNRVTLVKSWNMLQKVKGKYIESKLLSMLKPQDFLEYNFGVVLIPFAGLQHLEKESITQKDGKTFFSYEIWEYESNVIPACLWERMYLLKLKKGSPTKRGSRSAH